jgi:uncharacterized protein (TIGR02757 family)
MTPLQADESSALSKGGMKERKTGSDRLSGWLEELYTRFNHREYVHPDPVELLYDFEDVREREIVALVAAALAYGRAALIVKNAGRIVDIMGTSPRAFVLNSSDEDLASIFRTFRHRFTSGEDVAALVSGIRRALYLYGSLENCFQEGRKGGRASTKEALAFFRKVLCAGLPRSRNAILPDPAGKSACKRLHLFLKWMVRSDEVDPGGWTVLDPSALLVPLDTHMFSISRALGMTSRKGADFASVLEVTRAFSTICPEDPLRYDFVLTRFGIRPDLDKGKLLEEGAFLQQDENG